MDINEIYRENPLAIALRSVITPDYGTYYAAAQ